MATSPFRGYLGLGLSCYLSAKKKARKRFDRRKGEFLTSQTVTDPAFLGQWGKEGKTGEGRLRSKTRFSALSVRGPRPSLGKKEKRKVPHPSMRHKGEKRVFLFRNWVLKGLSNSWEEGEEGVDLSEDQGGRTFFYSFSRGGDQGEVIVGTAHLFKWERGESQRNPTITLPYERDLFFILQESGPPWKEGELVVPISMQGK